MTERIQLTAAAVLLVSETLMRDGGWTQHSFARRADGVEVDPHADDASSYCVLGSASAALELVVPKLSDYPLRVGMSFRGAVSELVRRALDSELNGSPAWWNDVDGREKVEVLEKTRQAACAVLGERAASGSLEAALIDLRATGLLDVLPDVAAELLPLLC